MRTIGPIAIIIASIGVFFGYTKPVWNGELKINWSVLNRGSNIEMLAKKSEEYGEALNNVAKVKERLQSLESVKNSFSESDYKKLSRVVSSENFNKVAGVWPLKFDPIRFAIELNSIAGKRGIQLKSLSVGSVGNAEGGKTNLPSAGSSFSSSYYRTSLSLEPKEFAFSFQASYPLLLQFISDLEHNLRIIDIKSISFTAGESPTYDVSMKIVTYELVSSASAISSGSAEKQ